MGGDDYTRTIWQHADNFEPSLVCPFAAYFAESQGAPLVILPDSQFAIIKPVQPGVRFPGDRHDAKLRRAVVAPADRQTDLRQRREFAKGNCLIRQEFPARPLPA